MNLILSNEYTTALAKLGETLDALSVHWPPGFDLKLAVTIGGEEACDWHQEGDETEWHFREAE